MKHRHPTRVVKLGGSLLATKSLETRLSSWLALQPPCATLVIVGGGELADGVRTLDRRHALPRLVAHEQAIRAMQVNAFVLLQLCSSFSWLGRLDDWDRLFSMEESATACVAILDPLPYMVHDEPQLEGARLPVGWHVTSDSIAARVAQNLHVEELVLLKSTLPPEHARSLQDVASAGFVDPYFPVVARHVTRVRVVDFRHSAWPERGLRA